MAGSSTVHATWSLERALGLRPYDPLASLSKIILWSAPTKNKICR